MIKHLPTGTWVPQLLSTRERSHYYSFLEGKPATAKSAFKAEDLNFKRGFKYKEESLALTFVAKMPEKLKLPNNTAEEILAMFEVKSFETYPREELSLCLPQTSIKQQSRTSSGRLKVERVDPNWFGFSDLHCYECGSLIPAGMQYLAVFGTTICSFCVGEAAEIIKMSVENFTDQELYEDIQTARFINRI